MFGSCCVSARSVGPTAPLQAARTGVFCPGSRLLLRGYCFCLSSYYLAADFTQVSHLRVRGTNYFLAVCQEKGGWKQPPPVCLLGQLVPEACGAWRVLMVLQGSIIPKVTSVPFYLLHSLRKQAFLQQREGVKGIRVGMRGA